MSYSGINHQQDVYDFHYFETVDVTNATDDAADTSNTNLSKSGLRRKDSTRMKSNFVLHPALGNNGIDLNGTKSATKSTISSLHKSNGKLLISIPLNLLKSTYTPKMFGNNATSPVSKQQKTFQTSATPTSLSVFQKFENDASSPVSKQPTTSKHSLKKLTISQKFGKILDFNTLQNEEGEHDAFHKDQIQNGNPSAGDDIIYDCTVDGYALYYMVILFLL